ncbi:MAG: hypothetical protein ACREEB_07380 [Caulobacteraceae bacterium]
MDDLDLRLTRCFSSVFPGLSNGELRSASPDTVAAWDSLSSLTLIAVVQEEFGVEIDPLDWPDLANYDAFRGRLGSMALT